MGRFGVDLFNKQVDVVSALQILKIRKIVCFQAKQSNRINFGFSVRIGFGFLSIISGRVQSDYCVALDFSNSNQ